MPQIDARFTTAGALARLEADGLSLLQYPATDLEAGPTQLWLRVRDGDTVAAHPLTGPESASRVGEASVAGSWRGVEYTAWFAVTASGYAWHWHLHNPGDAPVTCDVVLTQDVALTPLEELRRNEYYVAQYLDVSPVETRCGTALAVRQNMPGSGHPWLGLASTAGVAGWVTDAQQLIGVEGGLDLSQDLPGERLQHEHTLVGLQTPPAACPAGGTLSGAFVGVFLSEHPDATGDADAPALDRALADAATAGAPVVDGPTAVPTVFAPARHLPVRAARDADVPAGAVHVERGPDGEPWSAFSRTAHWVGRGKERAVLRPHGHVLHHAAGPVADGRSVASTAWMNGVFCSQLTRGNASSDPVVSLRRSYAGLSEAGGVRILVRHQDAWHLLGVPTWWAQEQTRCTWHYATEAGSITVEATVMGEGVRLGVACTEPTDVLVAIGTAADGLVVSGGDLGDDGPLFADGVSRGAPWRTVAAPAASTVNIVLDVEGGVAETTHAWALPRLSGGGPDASALAVTLPWLAQNAAVHYQAPRGLEQFTGGAWGTRDVCQGPVGLLLASGEHAALRETLLAVFAGQADDGDWPQWFDFLPDATPGHRESHGDVVYWPLLALGEYLQVTADASILAERVRFVGEQTFTEPVPVREHVERALDRLGSRRTRDARLPAYGHGDWNDSLQPARPELAEQMCSTWTSVLEVEALRALAEGLATVDAAWSDDLAARAERTLAALREVLLVDGELAGYGVVGDDGVELLVHPRDEVTGLTHGSLQMIHAIAGDLLTVEEAHHHVALIDEHLDGPHGIFLFDAPVTYSGGVMHVFKRAEAASFWGREIGLMYTHAHLRWIEACTRLGDAERAWAGLMKVLAVGVTDRVPGARPRQASCYYSSADAVFADRYEAEERKQDLFDQATPFEGGWRVYSSGPGLVLRLVTERLLGLRFRAAGIEVDPVLPPHLDGLVAGVPVPGGGEVEVTYRVGAAGHGVRQVVVDGVAVTGESLVARYRDGGVRLAPDALRAGSRVEIHLG